MVRKILFTAQKDSQIGEDGSINPTDPNKRHSKTMARTHISSKSNKEGLLTPYVSCSSTIIVPNLKYSYGKKRDKIDIDDKSSVLTTEERRKQRFRFNINRNQTRSRIFMIVCDDDITDAQSIKDLPSGMTCYDCELLESISKFSKADRESLIFGTIDSEHVFEIHPLLADILTKLELCIERYSSSSREQQIYDAIIEKIISGEYSIDNINQMIKEFKVNDVESKFIDQFYLQRANIADACFEAIPGMELPEDESERDELLVLTGSCLRNQVLLDIMPQLLARDFPEYRSRVLIGMDYFPIEEYISMTSLTEPTTSTELLLVPGILEIKDFRALDSRALQDFQFRYKKELPCGVRFECDDTGRAVSVALDYKSIEKNGTDAPKISTTHTSEKVWEDTEYFKNVRLQKDFVARRIKEQLEKSDADFNRIFRIIPGASKKEGNYVTFDEEGYCIIVGLDYIKSSLPEIKIIGYMRDKDGNKTRFDNNGRGTDIDGFDRAETNESGLPKDLTFDRIREMSQEEINNRIIETLDRYFEIDSDDLAFKNPPVERILKTCLSYILDPNLSENEKYEKSFSKIFGIQIEPGKITEEQFNALKNLIRGIFSIKEIDYGIDYKEIINEMIKSQIQKIEARTDEAKSIVVRGKDALKTSDDNSIIQDITAEDILGRLKDTFGIDFDSK